MQAEASISVIKACFHLDDTVNKLDAGSMQQRLCHSQTSCGNDKVCLRDEGAEARRCFLDLLVVVLNEAKGVNKQISISNLSTNGYDMSEQRWKDAVRNRRPVCCKIMA